MEEMKKAIDCLEKKYVCSCGEEFEEQWEGIIHAYENHLKGDSHLRE